MFTLTRQALAVAFPFCLFAATVAAAAAGGAADPADEVPTLISQLGDVDFKVRQAASDRLKEIGVAALPALKEAVTAAQDPEICSRADALVRDIERPKVPADWLGDDGFGGRGFGGTNVTTSTINGISRVTVQDHTGRRKVIIVTGPMGIDLAVTGIDDAGRPVTARFHARNAEQLRDQDPDAYRVYQRWAAGRNGAVMRGRRLIVPPGRGQFRVEALPQVMPEVRVRALPEPMLRPPADDLVNLEARVVRELQKADVPADQQRDVRDLLRRLQELQAEGQAIAPADWNKQILRYNQLSDALRDRLRDLKLPDPGDALPPPATSRLGISVAAGDPGIAGRADEGLLVARVMPDSRGERLGLREGDVIRSVNGKAVADTTALRRAVTEAKDPLVMEITRDAEARTLREKPKP